MRILTIISCGMFRRYNIAKTWTPALSPSSHRLLLSCPSWPMIQPRSTASRPLHHLKPMQAGSVLARCGKAIRVAVQKETNISRGGCWESCLEVVGEIRCEINQHQHDSHWAVSALQLAEYLASYGGLPMLHLIVCL